MIGYSRNVKDALISSLRSEVETANASAEAAYQQLAQTLGMVFPVQFIMEMEFINSWISYER